MQISASPETVVLRPRDQLKTHMIQQKALVDQALDPPLWYDQNRLKYKNKKKLCNMKIIMHTNNETSF